MDRNTLRKPYTLMCFDSSLSLNKVSLSMIYVIPKRFELLTYSLGNCCSIQLSYGTKNQPTFTSKLAKYVYHAYTNQKEKCILKTAVYFYLGSI